MSATKLSNKVFGSRMLLISSVLFVLFLLSTVVFYEVFGAKANAFVIITLMFSELSLGCMFAGDKIRKLKDN